MNDTQGGNQAATGTGSAHVDQINRNFKEKAISERAAAMHMDYVNIIKRKRKMFIQKNIFQQE